MSTLTPRRAQSTQAKGKEKAAHDHEHEHAPEHNHTHEHEHEHEHEHDHSHSHSHSAFSFGHSHSHADGGHGGAEQVVQALKGGGGDRGSRITLIGLAANVGLTVSKGAAGWYMNSASLLADAGHTAGDLIGDLITLFCWRLSRRPPSELYPYGFGKFEVLGTVAVSVLLTGGAFLLGYHSLTLLLESIAENAATLPPGPAQELLLNVTNLAHSMPTVEAGHAHEHTLDPNAAWFAAIGVLVKEWLFRATKRVADDENSPVLFANALHHRSDAYGSAVALVAILGTWWLPHLPLDQLGGLLISVLIVQQGWGITVGAFQQLTDASVTPQTKTALIRALEPLTSEQLLGIRDLRATRAGALMFVDLVASVPRSLSIVDASSLEAKIARTLKEARKEVQEVHVKFEPEGTE